MKPTLQQKLDEAKRRMAPIRQSLAWVFSTPPGREAIATLERLFIEENVPKDGNGAVDPNAVLIAFGRREVIDFMKKMIENEGQGDT
jgi:hypothetical protein